MAVSQAAVSVATTATRLDTAQDDSDSVSGESICVTNVGAAVVYVGGPSVTTATGTPIAVNEKWAADLSIRDALYGIVASGTVEVRVVEVGV